MTPSTPRGRELVKLRLYQQLVGEYESDDSTDEYDALDDVLDIEREAVEAYRLSLAEKVRAMTGLGITGHLLPRTALLRLIEETPVAPAAAELYVTAHRHGVRCGIESAGLGATECEHVGSWDLTRTGPWEDTEPVVTDAESGADHAEWVARNYRHTHPPSAIGEGSSGSTLDVEQCPDRCVGIVGHAGPHQGGDWPESLDFAWRQAEAALPEGGSLQLDADAFVRLIDPYWATAYDGEAQMVAETFGPTPAAALQALAARLRVPVAGDREP